MLQCYALKKKLSQFVFIADERSLESHLLHHFHVFHRWFHQRDEKTFDHCIFFSAWNIFLFLLLFLNGIYAESLLNVIYFYSLFYFTLKLFHRKDINNSFCMAKMLWHLCSACRRCYNILCYKCWAYGYHNGGAFRKTVLTTAASEGIFHLIKWK